MMVPLGISSHDEETVVERSELLKSQSGAFLVFSLEGNLLVALSLSSLFTHLSSLLVKRPFNTIMQRICTYSRLKL